MKRILTLLVLVTGSLLMVGCRGTPPPGIASQSNRLHEGLTRLVDAMPRTDPNRVRLLELLDESGKLKNSCAKVQEHWQLTDQEIRNLLTGQNP